MSRLIARTEIWEAAYSALENISFANFDYNTVKRSLIDQLRLTFPEFNDTIETSELIAIVELFAYVAELTAYRFDITAHENFLATAQRRDSILKLAKFLSYKIDRQIPARGLVKITSVRTSESIVDSQGTSLTNVTVNWNDANNSQWKEQFLLVMNTILAYEFGAARPSDRIQIQDIVFELYPSVAKPKNGVFSFLAAINGNNIPFELVPAAFDGNTIVERRPDQDKAFSFVYGNDGYGDDSNYTGFLAYIKQGTLTKQQFNLNGTPNQTVTLNSQDVNETDIWVNNVTTTGSILDDGTSPNRKTGEWVEVDLSHAQNIAFNTNPIFEKYEVETLDNNGVKIVFGDGGFAATPSGLFDVWHRISINEDIIVPTNAIVNQTASFNYVDGYGKTQTFTFTYSLTASITNNAKAESTEHVRLTAPAVYYTQDRMVTAKDHNYFPLQDSSILKLRAVNRTFVGDSRYATWSDVTTGSSDVKMLGTDGAIFFVDDTYTQTTLPVTYTDLITSYLESYLTSYDFLNHLLVNEVDVRNIRKTFTSEEKTAIITALTPPPYPAAISLFYNLQTKGWVVIKQTENIENHPQYSQLLPYSIFDIVQPTVSVNAYNIVRKVKKISFNSASISFWNEENPDRIIAINTLSAAKDKITILRANVNTTLTGVLDADQVLNVVGYDIMSGTSNVGIKDEHQVIVSTNDDNQDGYPDNNTLSGIIGYTKTIQTLELPKTITVPFPCLSDDITVTGTTNYTINKSGNVVTSITIASASNPVIVNIKQYVYGIRADVQQNWTLTEATRTLLEDFVADTQNLITRWIGRSSLNFVWSHYAGQYELINPSVTNIHDMYILTQGYFNQVRLYLAGISNVEPTPPTTVDLKTSYGYLLGNGMLSDEIILKPGKIKLIIGNKANDKLKMQFKVVRTSNRDSTEGQLKTKIVAIIRDFFDLSQWEFGETFYLTELTTKIQNELTKEIISITAVPTYSGYKFGDLFEIPTGENELLYPDISIDNIDIVSNTLQLS